MGAQGVPDWRWTRQVLLPLPAIVCGSSTAKRYDTIRACRSGLPRCYARSGSSQAHRMARASLLRGVSLSLVGGRLAWLRRFTLSPTAGPFAGPIGSFVRPAALLEKTTPTHGAPMPIDAYSPCPCGTGKKIKFCCKDLLSDLQKIERMLEGEQYMACLSHIERLEHSNPDRACLMATKTLLLRITGQEAEAKKATAEFVGTHPDNPLALCDTALITATEESGHAALSVLEKAIAASDGAFSGRLYEAISAIVQILLSEGHFLAARALTLFQASIVGQDDPSMELLMRLNAMQNVPLVVKDGRGLQQCPDEAPWKADFDAAFQLAGVARWSEAEAKLTELSQTAGQSSAVWRNLAKLRAWMANTEGAIEALGRFGTLDVGLEDAVEAQSMALFLSDDPLGDELNVFDVSYMISDAEKLQEVFSTSNRVAQAPMDPRMMQTEDDSPPPKAVYLFFDKPAPDSESDLDLETVPRVVCHGFFFGKETDRDARMECFGLVEQDRPLVDEFIRELDAEIEPLAKPSGNVSRTQDMLSREWRLPNGSSREEFQKIADAYLEEALLGRWVEMSLGLLDGKTPREAAGDPAYRVKLLAAIMVLDFWLDQSGARFDTNRLRSELGLATLETIDATEIPITSLPLVRLDRVDVTAVSDDDVLTGYRRAVSFGAQAAVERFGRELVGRPSLAERDERLQAYRLLARMTDNPDEAIELIEAGRQATVERGGSCANWDLLELSLRFERMESPEIGRLMSHIESQHAREPGVMEALTQMLVQMGVLRPDGSPAMPPGGGPAADPSLMVPGGEAEEPGKIWTPDGSSGSSEGEKPKLWTPGMD